MSLAAGKSRSEGYAGGLLASSALDRAYPIRSKSAVHALSAAESDGSKKPAATQSWGWEGVQQK